MALVNNPFRVGNAIYLRPLEKADAATIVPWLNDPDVVRTTLRYLPCNLNAEEQFIDQLYKGDDAVVLGIAVQESDELIGITGIDQIDHRSRHGRFGIIIGVKDAWNKGYGTETTRLMVRYAFDVVNLNRVWLHVHEHNIGAIRAYEKAGFRVEGRLRQENYLDGQYHDTIVMAILRQDWTG